MRPTLLLASLLAAASASALAAEGAPDAAGLREGVVKHVLACGAPFAKDLSRARLVAAFGAANVSDIDVPGAEGEGDTRETLLFAGKPADRVRFEWADEKNAKGVAALTISAGPNWLGPGAVHPGSTMQEVEKANGEAFSLYGLGWDYGGKVLDWRSGAFQTKPRGCTLGIDFTDNPATTAAAQAKVQGETKFLSDNPLLRAAKPIVSSLVLSF